ncbi:MAG: shikimate kinase [Planctomycetota bacterium]
MTPGPETPDPGTPGPGTPDPGTPDPGTPDPGTPDHGTPDHGTPDPGTLDPVTPAHVCLVGLRCAGKSTVGRILARELGWPFADLDQSLGELWAQEAGRSDAPHAGHLLATLGEPAFRELEARALTRCLASSPPLVLATGGGCVETPACREILLEARTFWIRVEIDELRRRLAADPAPRPSLTGATAVAEFEVLAARRGLHYRAVCEVELDGSLEPARVAAAIIHRLRACGGSRARVGFF